MGAFGNDHLAQAADDFRAVVGQVIRRCNHEPRFDFRRRNQFQTNGIRFGVAHVDGEFGVFGQPVEIAAERACCLFDGLQRQTDRAA